MVNSEMREYSNDDYVSTIKALDHFSDTSPGGQPKANLRPYRLHQDDVVGVEPLRDNPIKRQHPPPRRKTRMDHAQSASGRRHPRSEDPVRTH